MTLEPDQLLTLEQAAQRVQLSVWALRRAIHRGALRAYKPAGRIRIPADALQEWLEQSAPPTVAPVPRATLMQTSTPRPVVVGEDSFRARARRKSA